MANFVLADEINRAPAKVQSALLEVMAERHVTIGGRRLRRAAPFLVLATQNPIESEGVLPAARGAARPVPDEDRRRTTRRRPRSARSSTGWASSRRSPTPVITTDELPRLQVTASRVFVHHAIVDYVVRLVLATRTPAQHGMPDVAQWVSYGASPRASLGLIAAGRAMALLRGRDYVLPQDVLDVAVDVLPHRMVMSATTRSPTASPRFTRCGACCRRSRCRRSRPVSGPRGPQPGYGQGGSWERTA